jgi:tetratricopeptide (TPR) repeat protein
VWREAMSFEIECLSCGALTSPSVGSCPYCKTIVAPTKKLEKEAPQITAFKKLYQDSKLPNALYMGKKLWDESEKAKQSGTFLAVFAKVLFETESYPSLLNAVIVQGQFLKKPVAELNELSEIIQARPLLDKTKNDLGERQLKLILKNNPKSAYAHFILGTHLYYSDNEIRSSIIHLEECVKHHPKFLRAWGCLGAIYKELGKTHLAARAFKEAAKLETNSKMKKFFKSQI